MAVYSDTVIERISEQIEQYKRIKQYDNYVDTVINFIKDFQNEYDFLTESTIQDFLSASLKEKLFIDASNHNLIKEEFQRKSTDILF